MAQIILTPWSQKVLNNNDITLLDVMSRDELNDLLSLIIYLEEIDADATNYRISRGAVGCKKTKPAEKDKIVRFNFTLGRELYLLLKTYQKERKISLEKLLRYLLTMGLKYEAEKGLKEKEQKDMDYDCYAVLYDLDYFNSIKFNRNLLSFIELIKESHKDIFVEIFTDNKDFEKYREKAIQEAKDGELEILPIDSREILLKFLKEEGYLISKEWKKYGKK